MKRYPATAWFNKLKSVTRLLLCLGMAALVGAVALYFGLPVLTSLVLAWLMFSLGMVVLSWITFFTASNVDLYLEAKAVDENGPTIFLIVLLSVCVSVTGILVLMGNTDQTLTARGLHRIVSLLSIGFSWILLHTIFALHYAALYYKDNPTGEKTPISGLHFPEDNDPDYLDFAYFSFVIGMTFQVSDVDISSKHLRKLVLLHSLVSFAFNTIIVALTISILSNSGK
jgi:uncharacterized membrane protein